MDRGMHAWTSPERGCMGGGTVGTMGTSPENKSL
jgi:hypothetical protein